MAATSDATGGLLTVVVEYQRSGDNPADDAVEAVERTVDPDIAGGVRVAPVTGIGKLAYSYPDERSVIVAADKRLAFGLGWTLTLPPEQPQPPLTSQERRALLQLARKVVQRAAR